MISDTTAESMDRYLELMRRQAPADKARVGGALVAGVRRMAELGIRRDHPEDSDAEVRIRLVVRLYGREVAERFFGVVPADAA